MSLLGQDQAVKARAAAPPPNPFGNIMAKLAAHPNFGTHERHDFSRAAANVFLSFWQNSKTGSVCLCRPNAPPPCPLLCWPAPVQLCRNFRPIPATWVADPVMMSKIQMLQQNPQGFLQTAIADPACHPLIEAAFGLKLGNPGDFGAGGAGGAGGDGVVEEDSDDEVGGRLPARRRGRESANGAAAAAAYPSPPPPPRF